MRLNVLILFLFAAKHFYVLTAKVTPDANNSFYDGSLGIQNIATVFLKSIKSYNQMEHPIISHKITLTVFR